ncbi:Ig-like domain-containing protein [bacterium]|nr:Ig-like domain-containing protein [bacterium]
MVRECIVRLSTQTIILLSSIFWMAILATSCSDDEEKFLIVLATDPAEYAQQVPLDTRVRITFSEELNRETVDESSVSIFDTNGEKVRGTLLSVSGAVLLITFAEELDLHCTYQALITTTVSAMSGHELERNFHLQFTTRDGSWQNLERVGDGEWILSATISLNDSGRAILSWVQSIDGNYRVCAAFHDRTQGWGDSTVISCDVAGEPHSTSNCIDEEGNAFVLWLEVRETEHPFGTECDLWLARYSTESGWSDAVLFSESARGGRIASGQDGHALLIWLDDSQYYYLYSMYSPETGWRERERIPGVPRQISIAALNTDRLGTFLLFYGNYFMTSQNVIMFNTETGWGSPLILAESDWISSAGTAMNKRGDAITVLRTREESLWAVRLVNGTWQAPVRLTRNIDGLNISYADIDLSDNGDSMVIYDQAIYGENGVYQRSICVVRSTLSEDWSQPEEIDTTGEARMPRISLDAHGNAHAIWSKTLPNDQFWSVCSKRYWSARGWQDELNLEDRPDYFQGFDLATTDNGYAQVVMRCISGLYSTCFY